MILLAFASFYFRHTTFEGGGRVQAGIHPEYVDATLHCACGESFKTRSTHPEIRVEICSSCHPFFTGKQKIIDTEGRVERFQKKYAAGGKSQAAAKKPAPKSTRRSKA